MWVLHTCLCAVQGVAILAGGLAGDYLGSTRTILIGAFAAAVLAMPCFKAMGAGRFFISGLGQGVFNLALGFMGGSLPAWMVSMFPVQLRFSCIAVGYNAGQAIFGGTASIVGTMLVGEPCPRLVLTSSCSSGALATLLQWARTRLFLLSSPSSLCSSQRDGSGANRQDRICWRRGADR